VRAVFALGDTDQDGSISFLEFAKLMIPAANEVLGKFWKCFRDLKSVRAAFKQFDADKWQHHEERGDSGHAGCWKEVQPGRD
jgi:Ca2+-binding EF-hand superfamily protein